MFLACITSAGLTRETSVGWNLYRQHLERDAGFVGEERAHTSTGVRGMVDEEVLFAEMWRRAVSQFS